MKNKVILNDAFKRFTLDQDKTLPPEETVKQFKAKLNKIDLDILKKTVRIDNGRLNIPVFISYCGQDAKNVTGGKKQMGKGATPQQAEASAVMELVERFSLFSYKNNPGHFTIEKYGNIKDKAIDFQMIAQSVHDENNDPDLMEQIFKDVPLKWTWATNLTQNKQVLIPFDWFFNINEFNGSCAGNCAEEAICQGICEIVERHTSSLISQHSINLPAINPDSATDPLVVEMLNKYRHAGVKLHITDFTLDMGIPSVGILAYDRSTFPEKSEIVWTAGTTPNPQKALSRALTEVAQLAGDFNTGSCYEASGLPKFNDLEDAGFITNPEKTVDITRLPDLSDDNIKIEVQRCISSLAEKQMEVIAINTTHPLLNIPAFYMIIPGAHFRERSLSADVGMFASKLLTENIDPDHAIDKLTKIKALLPDKYYINFYLGQCYLSVNKPQTALDYFTASISQNPAKHDLASIYSYMGICFKDMGEYQKALLVLEEGERHDNERTDIYNLMGFCYFKLKEHQKAIDSFKKVLKLDPGSAIDYANIASNYRDMGKIEKAIEYYLTALGLDPSIEFARKSLEKLQ
ncbi:MAG: YcaO-like family protein [Thermodesulfobacteriota bacterium]|nr:YcaO-like family protein [Thermodesulfobacteriota bacterium]